MITYGHHDFLVFFSSFPFSFRVDLVYNYNQTKKEIRNSYMLRIICNEVHGDNFITFE